MTLRVGPGLQPYYVPEILLQALNNLPRSDVEQRTIDLQEVDVDTGHVIVHFLHTGQYQTLPNDDEETIPHNSKADFKKAIVAFLAAKKQRLTALKELAKDEIFQCAEGLSIVQVSHGVGKDVLTELAEDAAWLEDLILLKVERGFHDSYDVFASASFFSGIKSHRLAKLMGQHVARLYRDYIREPTKLVSKTEDTIAEGVNSAGKLIPDQIDARVPVVLSELPKTDVRSYPLPLEVECLEDERGTPATITKEKKKADHIAQQASSGELVPSALSVEPETARLSGPAAEALVVGASAVATTDSLEPTVERTINATDAEDPWAFLDSLPKKKKKKKSKRGLTSEQDQSPPPLEASHPIPEPEALLVLGTSTDATQAPLSEAHHGEIEGILPQHEDGIDNSPVVVEPEPPNVPEDPWDDWGALPTSSKKKKKKKKGAVTIVSEEVRSDPLPPPLPVTEDEPYLEVVAEPEAVEAPTVIDDYTAIEVPAAAEEVPFKCTPTEEAPAEEPVPEVDGYIPVEASQIAAPDPFAGLSKSQKKKLEKKMKDEAAAKERAELARMTVEEAEATESFAISEPSVRAPEPTVEVETELPREEPTVVTAELCSAIEDSPVVVEPPSTNPQSNDWGWDSSIWTSSDKKKAKKKKKAGQIEEPPPSPPPPPPPECAPELLSNEDFIEPVPEPEQEPEPAPILEDDYMETAGEVFCPWRYEHLTQDDRWKKCQECALYMRQIFFKP